MKFKVHSYRDAKTLFENDAKYKVQWKGILNALKSITEPQIIQTFNAEKVAGRTNKSISAVLNILIRERLVAAGWHDESAIFKAAGYKAERCWRLDFAKDEMSVEVGFNHGEAIAWNLLKPVMASELNHVEKAIQTSAGVIICATNALKKAGNFDNAVGSYEKFLKYLVPMRNFLTVPMAIIGLEAPTTFKMKAGAKKGEAEVVML